VTSALHRQRGSRLRLRLSRRINLFAYTIADCFLFTSCAQSAQPLTVHMQATSNQQERDETVSPDGSTTDFYPNRTAAREVVLHPARGGMLDAECMDSGCHQMSLKISGSTVVPDGAYQFLQTDDPRVIMVKDGEGTRSLGYFAQNDGGGAFKLFRDLAQAEQFEHQGDGERTAGKVVVGALLVTAIAALVVGAAAVDAEADRTTTRCFFSGNNSTCTTYSPLSF
jgi:hypothetical protein